MADRIILTITSDLFDDDPHQEVSVRANVPVRTLIAEAIKEFSLPESSYILHLPTNDTPLAMDMTMEQLGLQTGAELVFERVRNRMSQVLIRRGGNVFHTILNTQRAFLRERETGTEFEIKWQPALIGRPDSSVPASAERLAVNLGELPQGRSVSRQHARLTESNGHYFLEGLTAQNPTYLNDAELVIGEKRGLKVGDVVRVGKIELEFVIKNRANNGLEDAGYERRTNYPGRRLFLVSGSGLRSAPGRDGCRLRLRRRPHHQSHV